MIINIKDHQKTTTGDKTPVVGMASMQELEDWLDRNVLTAEDRNMVSTFRLKILEASKSSKVPFPVMLMSCVAMVYRAREILAERPEAEIIPFRSKKVKTSRTSAEVGAEADRRGRSKQQTSK